MRRNLSLSFRAKPRNLWSNMNTWFKFFSNKHLRRFAWVLLVIPAFLARPSFFRALDGRITMFLIVLLASTVTSFVVYTYSLWTVERLAWKWFSKKRFTIGYLTGLLLIAVSPSFLYLGILGKALGSIVYVPAMPFAFLFANKLTGPWFSELLGWYGKVAYGLSVWATIITFTPIMWGVIVSWGMERRSKR